MGLPSILPRTCINITPLYPAPPAMATVAPPAPAVRVRRANMDTSWLLTWGPLPSSAAATETTETTETTGTTETAETTETTETTTTAATTTSTTTTVLLDPWLVESEVDLAPWFSEQRHATPPLAIDALGAVDAVVVSQPFSDHCHEATLRQLPADLPVYAVPAAVRRIRADAELRTRRLVPIPPYPAEVELPGGVRASHLPAPLVRLDVLHGALLLLPPAAPTAGAVTGAPGIPRGGAVLYAPHGYRWPPAAKPPLPAVDVLMCTCARYGLPLLLGGTVNLGLEAAAALAAACTPRVVIDTHSEQKPSTGLVVRVATPTYPDAAAIEHALGPCVRHITTYDEVDLG